MKIYYDGHCPLCRNYVVYKKLRAQVKDLQLVDLRQNPEALRRLSRMGLDLDQGMVVEHNGSYYHGASAVSYIAGKIDGVDFFLKWELAAQICYPIMRIIRNIILFFMTKSPLSVKPEYAGIQVLSQLLGLFAFLHLLVYAFQFGHHLYITTYFIGLLGFFLFVKPHLKIVLIVIIITMVVDAILQAPVLSNHTILKNFFLLAVVVVALYSMLQAGGWESFFDGLLPIARSLLLIMYFFGVFHKINAGFLDPNYSCSAALWQTMPRVLNTYYFYGQSYLLMYGTLVIESLLILMLLLPRFRLWGIFLGSAFHVLLAFSGYALYATFSLLTVFLHFCFFSFRELECVALSPLYQEWLKLQKRPAGWVVVVLLFLPLGLLSWLGSYSLVAVPVFFYILFLMVVVWKARRLFPRAQSAGLASSYKLANLVSLFFFINCALPYLGMKTSQSMNMFANLHLEGGVTNHYIMPAPTGYLKDVVKIVSASGDVTLEYAADEGLWLVYYDLLNRLDRSRSAKVTFVRDGVETIDASYETVKFDALEILHSRFFRSWFHFNLVDMNSPKPCALDR